jgi:hypothetical protein
VRRSLLTGRETALSLAPGRTACKKLVWFSTPIAARLNRRAQQGWPSLTP